AWQKANPNLGISVNPDDLADQCRMAKEIPTEMVEFLTKRLNVWVYGESKWMNMERWHECRVDYDTVSLWTSDEPNELDGMDCHAGLDLASTEDICSFGAVFVMPNGKRRIIGRHYLPEAALERR